MNFLKHQQSESFVFGTTLAEIAFIMFFLLVIISSHKEIGFESAMQNMQDTVADISEENARMKQAISKTKSDLVNENIKLKDENDILSQANEKIKEENKKLENRILAEKQIARERLGRVQAELKKIRNARGRPECWEDENNRIQPLYQAIIHENFLEIRIKKATWVARDAETSNSIYMEPVGKHHSQEAFNNKVGNVKKHADESGCVHYVEIYDKANTKTAYKNWRRALERKFYPIIKE